MDAAAGFCPCRAQSRLHSLPSTLIPHRYSAGGAADSQCDGECQAGFYCPAASTKPDQKPCGSPAFVCPPGVASPVPVDAGKYSGPLSAPPTMRTEALMCAIGHACSGNGHMTACPAGKWGGESGLSDTANCDGDCSAGRYGTAPGQTTSQCEGPCAAGYYCVAGSVAPDAAPCPAGRWGGVGEVNASCSGECRAGFACPPASTSPTQRPCGGTSVYCPPGSGAAVPAPAGYYTVPEVAGSGEVTRTGVVLCSIGSYCPGDGIRHLCPSGTYVEFAPERCSS